MSTPEAYGRQLKALLPRGIAWNLEPGSKVSRVLLALADELARVDARARNLEAEIDPRTTLELLPDWEAMLGLPDVCAPAGQSLQARRAAVVAKYTRLGGQSPQFFIDLAAALGYEITVSEFPPFRAGFAAAGDALTNDEWAHAWRVNAPETTFRRFTAGASAAGESLREWGNEELECVISLRKPAHTVLSFGYPPPTEGHVDSVGALAGSLTVDNEKELDAGVVAGGAPAGQLTVEKSLAAAMASAGLAAGDLTVAETMLAAAVEFSTPHWAPFDRGNPGMTGVTDSPIGSFILVYKLNQLPSVAGNNLDVLTIEQGSVSNSALEIWFRSSDDKFEVHSDHGGGLSVLCDTAETLDDEWHCVMASWDPDIAGGGAGAVAHLYRDDVNALQSVAHHTSTPDITRPTHVGGHGWESIQRRDYDGQMALIWYLPGTTIDFSDSDIRHEIWTAANEFVLPDADGSTATLPQPKLCMMGDATAFKTNVGSGGGFTDNMGGGLTTVAGPELAA